MRDNHCVAADEFVNEGRHDVAERDCDKQPEQPFVHLVVRSSFQVGIRAAICGISNRPKKYMGRSAATRSNLSFSYAGTANSSA